MKIKRNVDTCCDPELVVVTDPGIILTLTQRYNSSWAEMRQKEMI